MKKITEFLKTFSLQLFAEAGNLVNATGNYVNAYTGQTTAFDANNTLAPEIKDFYDTELLENARIELFYAQFAKKQPLPRGHGGRVEWRKVNTFARASQLTEGVIPTGQKFGVSTLYGSIHQYGTYAAITDRLELRAYDNIIMAVTEEMGASAAETQEALIRDALMTGTNVLYCDKITRATGAAAQVATEAGLTEDATYHCHLTADMVNRAVTIMKKNKVPRIGGDYIAVIHPSAAYDLRSDPGWLQAHEYAAPEQIFNGEIGKLHGVRFIENVFAPVIKASTEGAIAKYATFFFGKDSFGIIDPEGGAMEMIVHDKHSIGGPLDQFSTIGYKFETNGATILYPERLLRVMSTSFYSSTDEAN